ncbi:MAG: hypothetical protein H0X03_00700 [Nitrosopumilus sp.]|nr:hypothetical protein [Nitrosopumilus sp.]
MYSFIINYGLDSNDNEIDAGVIIMLYNNHIHKRDDKLVQIHHKYIDIINATTHIH